MFDFDTQLKLSFKFYISANLIMSSPSFSAKLKAPYLIGLLSFLCAGGLGLILHYFYQSRYFTKLQSYTQNSYQIERGYIEKLPIYADYITAQKEKELRTYLLPYHIKAAQSRQAKPLASDQEIETRLARQELNPIDEKFEEICFFYNVRKKYRYLSPRSKKVLWHLGQRFQKLLQEKGLHHRVRFAVSSALRPVDYQKHLGQRNANATLVSSHSYGESFDIFFDEFYVVLDEVNEANEIDKISQADKAQRHDTQVKGPKTLFERKLRRRLGFLMGQALRRQFRSVLTEAVLQLQAEGQLYAVLEKRQRCYHITAR